MPEVPEDLDVFRRPHFHLKQLVKDIQIELHGTNFLDSMATHTLLAHLLSGFREFKSHEEIENQYIVKELLPRLPSHIKATLENDIHSSNRLSDLVTFVDSGLQLEWGRSEQERVEFGNKLKETIRDFNIDFIPHMDEEEEVYLPLLLEHFSESELRDLTLRVLELHQLQELPLEIVVDHHPQQAPLSLTSLPPEVLLQILSYLSPQDLLKLSPLHSTLKSLTFDPTLWEHLHPVRWAAGHWEFFRPPLLDDQEMLSNGIIEDNDVIKELLSVGTMVNANLANSGCYDDDEDSVCVQKEIRVLRGVVDHLLPQVGGAHIRTLDLSHGKAISNEMVFRLLRYCPNLVYLDLSYTKISDFAFRGLLSKISCRWKLEYLDISGCHLVTDTALQKLAQSLVPHPRIPHPTSSHLGGFFSRGGGRDGGGGGGGGDHPQLKCLILSGCHAITDKGLRSLALTPGLFPHLCYLNLSGLPIVTHKGLTVLVAAAPTLSPELLFYCDNIPAGPYSECANGCQNVGSASLQCCRLSI